MDVTLIEFFSGIGGMRVAIQNFLDSNSEFNEFSGLKTMRVVPFEINLHALKAYNSVFKE